VKRLKELRLKLQVCNTKTHGQAILTIFCLPVSILWMNNESKQPLRFLFPMASHRTVQFIHNASLPGHELLPTKQGFLILEMTGRPDFKQPFSR
jgi:hypothetical protein